MAGSFSAAFSPAFGATMGPVAISRTCIPVDWSCLGEEALAALDPGVQARAEQFAQISLRILTGFQVGGCPITVRPCVGGCAQRRTWVSVESAWMFPYILDGKWYNTCGCLSIRGCSCSALTQIRLHGPVAIVSEVKVDGEVLDSDMWRLDNYNTLVRVSGPAWPTCQDMTAEDSEVGTMSVTYVQGAEVDATGAFVAGLLAKEFVDLCTKGSCSLPSGVTQVTRRGATMEFGADIFPNNRTGIQAVDIWVRQFNPYGVKAPARVFSPDRPAYRHPTSA